MDHQFEDNLNQHDVDHDKTPSDRCSSDEIVRLEVTDDSLFEQYERRSLEEILAAQNAVRESEAAHAAAVILDGVETPTFDESHSEYVAPKEYDRQAYTPPNGETDNLTKAKFNYPQIHVQRLGLKKIRRLDWVLTPGAQFVYALLILTTLSGLIGLAASMQSPALILIAGIASPILLPICIWKWIRWLDSTPYYYRLMTSLGEDARNLMTSRLFFWVRVGQKSKH